MLLLTTFASARQAAAHASVVAISRASAAVVTVIEVAHAVTKVTKKSKLTMCNINVKCYDNLHVTLQR